MVESEIFTNSSQPNSLLYISEIGNIFIKTKVGFVLLFRGYKITTLQIGNLLVYANEFDPWYGSIKIENSPGSGDIFETTDGSIVMKILGRNDSVVLWSDQSSYYVAGDIVDFGDENLSSFIGSVIVAWNSGVWGDA